MSSNPSTNIRFPGRYFTRTIHNDTYSFIKPMQWKLQGKAVLVTGASKGIGRALAVSYAQAGASMLALGARSGLEEPARETRQAAKDAGQPEPTILLLKLDVTDGPSIDAAATQIRSRFGRLDIVVNNAGYLEAQTVAQSDPAIWWQTWETNILGPYLVARAMLPILLGTSDSLKTVLNVSSTGAHVAFPGMSAYQCSKLALIRFGEFLNAEHRDQGLLSYAVHPGAVPTELALGIAKERHALLTDTPQLGADSIVFLTAERRDWLAGRFVSVNWDMEQLLAKRDAIEMGDLLKIRMDVGLEE